MMMIFSIKKYLFVIFIFIFSNVYSDAISIFKNNKEHILEKGIVLMDNFFFSVGCAMPKTKSTMSKDIAFTRAKHNAFIGFFRVIENNIKHDIQFDVKLEKKLIYEFQKFVFRKEYILGSVEIFKLKKNGNVYSVLACPYDKNKTLNKQYSMVQIIERLHLAFENNNPLLSKSIYLEIANDKNKNKARIALINKLEVEYGKNVKNVLLQQKVTSIDANYFLNLKSEKLNILTAKELLILLENIPYNEKVLSTLIKKLKDDGLTRNSEMFAKSLLVLKNGHSPINYNLTLKECDINNIGKEFEFIEKKVNNNFNLIIKSKGLLPLLDNSISSNFYKKGNSYFFNKPVNIELALNQYIKELDFVVNANTCNMIGACFRELKKYHLALIFFQQAVNINNNHKYAMVNLALNLNNMNKFDLAQKYARLAKQNKNLDNWAKSQINKILK